jgi:hypothetical protein
MSIVTLYFFIVSFPNSFNFIFLQVTMTTLISIAISMYCIYQYISDSYTCFQLFGNNWNAWFKLQTLQCIHFYVCDIFKRFKTLLI